MNGTNYPLIERINAFWDDFIDAPYERQWALVTEMLAEEPELFDGKTVFEITNTLFDKAVEAGEVERYKQLLDQLEESVPEAYAEELSYILEWRIQIALIEGNRAGKEHLIQFADNNLSNPAMKDNAEKSRQEAGSSPSATHLRDQDLLE